MRPISTGLAGLETSSPVNQANTVVDGSTWQCEVTVSIFKWKMVGFGSGELIHLSCYSDLARTVYNKQIVHFALGFVSGEPEAVANKYMNLLLKDDCPPSILPILKALCFGLAIRGVVVTADDLCSTVHSTVR